MRKKELCHTCDEPLRNSAIEVSLPKNKPLKLCFTCIQAGVSLLVMREPHDRGNNTVTLRYRLLHADERIRMANAPSEKEEGAAKLDAMGLWISHLQHCAVCKKGNNTTGHFCLWGRPLAAAALKDTFSAELRS